MHHSSLRAQRAIFRNNSLASVGGFSHFFILLFSHAIFLTVSFFFSDHRLSSPFLLLALKREGILRKAVFLFRPLISCLFISFSSVLSLFQQALKCQTHDYLPFTPSSLSTALLPLSSFSHLSLTLSVSYFSCVPQSSP